MLTLETKESRLYLEPPLSIHQCYKGKLIETKRKNNFSILNRLEYKAARLIARAVQLV